MRALFDSALWFAAAGHFLVLFASFQVPSKLGWREDLSKLIPFNRKLIWKGGAFIVMTIVAFGILTIYLHNEMLQGTRVASGIAVFIGIFWTARVLTDLFYFSHGDWPKGLIMTIGHYLLTALFIALAATYLGLSAWHVCKG